MGHSARQRPDGTLVDRGPHGRHRGTSAPIRVIQANLLDDLHTPAHSFTAREIMSLMAGLAPDIVQFRRSHPPNSRTGIE
jgi:hypothetical protein